MYSKPRLTVGVSLAFAAVLFACKSDETPPPATPITVPANPQAMNDAAAMSGMTDANPTDARGVDAASIDTRPAAAKDAASDAPSDATSSAQTKDFYSCAADIDCIAVPKVGCCSNGYKEAVNQESATAYAQSFTCPTPNQMCPHYILNDTRVPECNGGTHKCEMVAIDQIKCGGLGTNPHVCPSDHRCVTPKTPTDATGHCKK